MFQNFDDLGGPEYGAERLGLLRRELDAADLAGFLLPRGDEYQTEFIPPDAEQLLWLTGFSGSWGFAAILRDRAALFIDGRYTLQAVAQVDRSVFEIVNVGETSLAKWLEQHIRSGDRLGYDPRLHTVSQLGTLRKSVEKAGGVLVPLETNPLDQLWTDRPSLAIQPVALQPVSLTGREASEKIGGIQARLEKDRRDAVIVSALDSIAWLFNIRGNDLPHTPFVQSYAVIPASGKARLFVDSRKLTPELRDALEPLVAFGEIAELPGDLRALGLQGARVQLDPASATQWVRNLLKDAGAAIEEDRDPCLLPKARKTSAEIDGSRMAHRRDGAAVCRFLCWLDDHTASGELDEITAAKKLEEFRRATNRLRDISFDTIAGAGHNGAIVHYRPSHATNRRLEPGSLFLIDSGGQYEDGTTDITRTIAVGEPNAAMRRHYTLVLKGHIAVSMLRFPKGTRGSHIDAMARRPLWEAGLDYDHGTGHGVGSFLSVHEGPQSIAKRESVELEPGMILSNEPGYYREGEYGIRLENLVLVTEPAEIEGGDRPMMGFESLTLAPFDRRLIDRALLSPAEAAWVDDYHRSVLEKLGAQLDGEALSWLERMTAPLAN